MTKRIYTNFCSIILILMSGLAYSFPVSEKKLTLIIQPDVCVIEQKNDLCTQTLLLAFNQPIFEPFCVYVKPYVNQKHCFNADQHQKFSLDIQTNVTIEIVVEKEKNQAKLTSAILKVAQYKPVRKRRNFGWNLL